MCTCGLVYILAGIHTYITVFMCWCGICVCLCARVLCIYIYHSVCFDPDFILPPLWTEFWSWKGAGQISLLLLLIDTVTQSSHRCRSMQRLISMRKLEDEWEKKILCTLIGMYTCVTFTGIITCVYVCWDIYLCVPFSHILPTPLSIVPPVHFTCALSVFGSSTTASGRYQVYRNV